MSKSTFPECCLYIASDGFYNSEKQFLVNRLTMVKIENGRLTDHKYTIRYDRPPESEDLLSSIMAHYTLHSSEECPNVLVYFEDVTVQKLLDEIEYEYTITNKQGLLVKKVFNNCGLCIVTNGVFDSLLRYTVEEITFYNMECGIVDTGGEKHTLFFDKPDLEHVLDLILENARNCCSPERPNILVVDRDFTIQRVLANYTNVSFETTPLASIM